jgi:hypothetical protein
MKLRRAVRLHENADDRHSAAPTRTHDGAEPQHYNQQRARRAKTKKDIGSTNSAVRSTLSLSSSSSGSISLSQWSFNVTAAVLRRMAHVSIKESRATTHSSSTSRRVVTDDVVIHIEKSTPFQDPSEGVAAAKVSSIRKELLVTLIERVGQQLVAAQEVSLSSTPSTAMKKRLDIYPLSDALQALAVLAQDEGTKHHLRPLAEIVVTLLYGHDSQDLYRLGPIRLVQCLQAIAKLAINHPAFQERIYQRLLKPDAVSKLPPQFLAHGLWALATFQKNYQTTNRLHQQHITNSHNEVADDSKQEGGGGAAAVLLSRAFMRRLRKKKVLCEASTQDLLRGLVASRNLLELGAMKDMEDEAAIFGFTSLRAVLDNLQRQQHDVTVLLTSRQFVDMISSWACLSSQGREDSVIDQLLHICLEQETLQLCNLSQLEHITRSITKLENVTTQSDFVQRIGEQLLTLVQKDGSTDFTSIRPRTVNEILRHPVLSHRQNKDVVHPYIRAASLLLTSDTFVNRCNVGEIADFLWFLSAAKCYDSQSLIVIGRSLLDSNISDACSPKMASRILATFTSLVALEENDLPESSVEVTKDLFHAYGGHLLSSSLSPAEASAALYAYAKSAYIKDMGVFDHLVNLLASMAGACSSRQLSQSLWSCGKMVAWEEQKLEEDTDDVVDGRPPYFENALSLAIELSTRIEEMTPEDTTQTIWALGKLDVNDKLLMGSFIERALSLAPSMNIVEISNILWGMAKTRYKDRKAIAVMANRLMDSDMRIPPRVAASCLYAFGRLRYRDEELYSRLARTMINSIEDVNTQSITNSLWSFRTMRIRPPDELMHTWAVHKLGITSIDIGLGLEAVEETNLR